MDREELKRLTEEEMGWRIREGAKAVIEQVLEGGDAKGHGGLGFQTLPGHRPTLGHGRETHKNRNLTGRRWVFMWGMREEQVLSWTLGMDLLHHRS
jgi:hypothetical protein